MSYSSTQTPVESGMDLTQFGDGVFAFVTAQYGSWANDNRIVFRVREDSTPEMRANEKDILYWDRILPALPYEIVAWLRSHPDFVPV